MLLVLFKCSKVPLTLCTHEQELIKKALHAKMVDPQKLMIDLNKGWEERATPLLLKQRLPAFCPTSAESAMSLDSPIHDAAISVRQTWQAPLSLGRKVENPQANPIAVPVHATAIKKPWTELPDSTTALAQPMTDAIGTAMASDVPGMAEGKTDWDGSGTLSVVTSSGGSKAAAIQLQPLTQADEGDNMSSAQKNTSSLQLVTEGRAFSLSARYPHARATRTSAACLVQGQMGLNAGRAYVCDAVITVRRQTAPCVEVCMLMQRLQKQQKPQP